MVTPRSLTPLSSVTGSSSCFFFPAIIWRAKLWQKMSGVGGAANCRLCWHNLMVGHGISALESQLKRVMVQARPGVKMSNHSWVFSCCNESRVIQEKRIINIEDFEVRVSKHFFQDGDWDAFPGGWSWSGQEGGKRNSFKREEGRRRREVRHPWAEEQVKLKS